MADLDRKFRGKQPLILLGIFFAFSLAGFSQDIHWIFGYDQGMRLARKRNRPVLVDFWSQWCIPCSRAENGIFADPRVIEASVKYVCIRVDVDTEPAASGRFGVKSLPAERFLDPLGAVLLQIDKSVTADEILTAMKSLPDDFEPVAGNFAELEGDPGNAEALRVIAEFYTKAGLTAPAREYFARADKAPPSAPDQVVRYDPWIEPSPQALPPAIRLQLLPLSTPASHLAAGKGVPIPALPLVRRSIDELLERYPERLKGVEFAPDQKILEPLLKKVGDSATEFIVKLPNTTATELIRQERLRTNGKIEAKIEQEVGYLLLNSGDLREDRIDRKGNAARLRRLSGMSFLSSGFALGCALFLPEFQKLQQFRYLGKESSETPAHLIAFSEISASRSIPGKFTVKGKEVFYSIDGIVWIDADTHQIVRMMTDLREPVPEAYLTKHSSEISYGEIRFGTLAKTFWLPREVVITTEYKGRTYRNIHRYSEYKVFTVESYEERKPMPQPASIK